MPSVVQTRSYGSVKVFWLDRERAIENLREGAKRLGSAKPEALSVRLFGSLAEGRAVPGSDADVLVLLNSSRTRFLDRPLEYLPYFSDCGIGVDLFCYTPDEAKAVPLARAALARALILWDREAISAE